MSLTQFHASVADEGNVYPSQVRENEIICVLSQAIQMPIGVSYNDTTSYRSNPQIPVALRLPVAVVFNLLLGEILHLQSPRKSTKIEGLAHRANKKRVSA